MPLFGKTDALTSVPKNLRIGRLTGINVLTGGAGYTNGATQTVTITGGGGSGATATALVAAGAVVSVTLTNGGVGYTSTPTLSIPGTPAPAATFLIKQQPGNTAKTNDDNANIIFVDDVEAALASNKSKGIHSPGWWRVITRQLSDGTTRYITELLVTMTSVAVGTGDKEEDLVAADVESVASISVQPTPQSTTAGGATFSLTAAITGGGAIAYQWQKALNGSNTFANVAGQTAASIVLTGQTAGNTGDRYRCVVSGGGVRKLNSNTVALTFGT